MNQVLDCAQSIEGLRIEDEVILGPNVYLDPFASSNVIFYVLEDLTRVALQYDVVSTVSQNLEESIDLT